MKKLLELIRARRRAITVAAAACVVAYPSSTVIIEAVTAAVSIVSGTAEHAEEGE